MGVFEGSFFFVFECPRVCVCKVLVFCLCASWFVPVFSFKSKRVYSFSDRVFIGSGV